MLTLTWSKLNEPQFVNAVVKLANNRQLDNVTAYRVGRICTTADRAMKTCREKEMELKKKFFKVDDKGNFVVDEATKQLVGLTEKAEEEYDAAFNSMMEANTVTVKVHKLDFSKLNGLTGLELTAIEEIVDSIPEVA